jgi:hypothetical protein
MVRKYKNRLDINKKFPVVQICFIFTINSFVFLQNLNKNHP